MIAVNDRDGLLSIGQFAERTGLTLKALRLYDQRGLLLPAATDLHSGYRYYSPDQIETARYILLLREAGMPLAEIASLLSAPHPREATGAIQRHRDRVESAIRHSEDALLILDKFTHIWRENKVMADEKTEYRCSFCGKVQTQVDHMIRGPGSVYICNECVDLCNQIIESARTESPSGA